MMVYIKSIYIYIENYIYNVQSEARYPEARPTRRMDLATCASRCFPWGRPLMCTTEETLTELARLKKPSHDRFAS